MSLPVVSSKGSLLFTIGVDKVKRDVPIWISIIIDGHTIMIRENRIYW